MVGQKFRENIFSDNILKTIWKKNLSILKNFWWPFFQSSTTFFQNFTPFIQNIGYSLFFVFFFLCLCFCFLSCFLYKNKKNKKFSSDYWEGKNGILPHLNYWVARARAAPQSLRLWFKYTCIASNATVFDTIELYLMQYDTSVFDTIQYNCLWYNTALFDTTQLYLTQYNCIYKIRAAEIND